MPYNSITKPINAHFISISVMPSANAAVPFHFCLRAKKESVFVVPIRSVRPIRKRICCGQGLHVREGLEGRTLPMASLEDKLV
jgi:hypothetical protein